MTQRILRIAFTLLALLMGIAGTQGLNMTSARNEAPGTCQNCGCTVGGTIQCCTNGGTTCFTGAGGIVPPGTIGGGSN